MFKRLSRGRFVLQSPISRHAWIGLTGAALTISAPAAACTGTPSIYFDYGSSALTDSSRATLEIFVSQLQQRGGLLRIEVSGHSDATGSRAARFAVAERRAAAVRDFLVARGLLPAAAITIRSFGDSRPEVETPDGVREPNNRRATMIVTYTPEALAEQARARDEMIRNGMPIPLC